MSDLRTQLVAAVQQVRTSTPRECDEWCETIADSGFDGLVSHSNACVERWAARVDARLAACVEATIEAAGTAQRRSLAFLLDPTAMDDSHIVSFEAAGLAAFLATAAQEDK